MSQEKKQMSIGCTTALFYSIDALFVIGGLLCLPWGFLLIIIGVIGFFASRKVIKEHKQKEQEVQMIRDNTKEELAIKTLSVIEKNEPIESLDSNYAGLTLLQRECTLNKALEEIVKKGSEDGIITDEEEAGIKKFIDHFGIPNEKFEHLDWYDRYQKLLVIKDLLNGIIPQRRMVSTSGFFLNLTKGEQLIWRFDNVAFWEEVKITRWQGGSSGISVKVAKGVYYRVGATRGTPITKTSMVEKAVGTLFVATQHLYFYSEYKVVKIPYSKVVAYTPYTDGLGVLKDGVSAKPQAFQGLDGWFIYNLVTNVTNL